MPSLLLLIGAPKCGTSSLFNWLSQAPSIDATAPKETYNLIDSSHPLSKDLKATPAGITAEITKCLNDLPPGKLWHMEGTTHNYYQELALQVSANLLPNVKTIFVMRRPADRILSSFLYTQNNLSRLSRKLDFDSYCRMLLNAETSEIEKHIQHSASRYVLTRELHLTNYPLHLQRWRNTLGEEKIMVVVAERLFRSTCSEMRRIAEFLHLPSDTFAQGSLLRRNETKRITFQRFHRLAIALGRLIPETTLRREFKRLYFAAQGTGGRGKTENYKASLQELDEYFSPQVKELKLMLKDELPEWNIPR
jgi:hypothetical protein